MIGKGMGKGTLLRGSEHFDRNAVEPELDPILFPPSTVSISVRVRSRMFFSLKVGFARGWVTEESLDYSETLASARCALLCGSGVISFPQTRFL